MTECKRHDVAEKLAMALSPEDFPADMAEVDRHLQECTECREELKYLMLLDNFLKQHKDELAPAFEKCPTEEALMEFATGEARDASVADHLDICEGCREFVRIVRELHEEDLAPVKAEPSLEEKALIRAEVAREYGLKEKPELQPQPGFLQKLTAALHIPSMALGAVVAALLVVVLLPQRPVDKSLRPVLSDAMWKIAPSEITKTPGDRPHQPGALNKVALVLMIPADSVLSQAELDRIYENLDLPRNLSTIYRFIPPAEMKQALAEAKESADISEFADLVLTKSGANYLLLFEVLKSPDGYKLNGSVFRPQAKTRISMILQTRLKLEDLPSRISAAGSELLMEADFR